MEKKQQISNILNETTVKPVTAIVPIFSESGALDLSVRKIGPSLNKLMVTDEHAPGKKLKLECSEFNFEFTC